MLGELYKGKGRGMSGGNLIHFLENLDVDTEGQIILNSKDITQSKTEHHFIDKCS